MLPRFLYHSTLLAISVFTISSAATAQQQPFPGKYCEAETIISGDRWLYRTSFINKENLKTNGQPVEVDLLKNGEYAALASTHFTNNFTFTGTTETGTPISFQIDPTTDRFQVTHADRTVVGSCRVDILPAVPTP
jgi:hypothetical protein